MIPRLLKKYREEIVPEMIKRFGYKSIMEVPRLEKIVINMGIGEAARDIKILEKAMEELAMITGQRPAIRRARKAISNFKIRKGMPVGCKVTLRRARMYEFFDRFVNVILPRLRDFRGVPNNSFDGRGSYNFGLAEQTIFPEIDLDKVSRVQGMDIAFVTTAKTDEEAKVLLQLLGMPFRKRG